MIGLGLQRRLGIADCISTDKSTEGINEERECRFEIHAIRGQDEIKVVWNILRDGFSPMY